jgi:integrase
MSIPVLKDARKTGEPGVYYREHPTRKNGVKFDRQWIIRQTLGGVQRVSIIGWWSEGHLLGDALNKAAEYKANHRWNKANPDQPPKPVCKQDEDEAAERKRQELEHQRQIEERKNITILQIWKDLYFPLAQQHKKPATVTSERTLFDKWIRKDYGNKRLNDLTKLDFARLSKKITKAGRSPRTVHYVASVLLQIWSTAFDNDLVEVQPPRRKTLNLPDIDNERTRAFTLDEAKLFLAALKDRSPQWHDICLLSLLTGLRASEVFKLQKSDIDLDRGLIFLRSPKKARSQHLQISTTASNHIADMLERSNQESEHLVCNRNGNPIKWVSDTVERTIEKLGLNEGVDKKSRLTFHSLRHTAATWALEQGADIYHVSKMLRHTTVRMTEQRYAHLSNDTIRNTADTIGSMLESNKSKMVSMEKTQQEKK